MEKDRRENRMAFMAYKIFFETSYPGRNMGQYTFYKSTMYLDFLRFGKYLVDIQAVNPQAFVRFLLRVQIPLSKWQQPFVYEQYIRELNKKETPVAAVERNILLFEQWALKEGKPWYDFFREVHQNDLVLMIKTGRISPWVLYLSESAMEVIARLDSDQLKMINGYIEPRFWSYKFDQEPEAVLSIKEILRSVNL